jgi:hypothetical protein
MADDAAPILPDDHALAERARKAGVDIDALSDLARIRLLREFYTPSERKAAEAKAKAEWPEVVRQYNDWVDENGFWNASIKPW